jgi:hypothetical protein
MQLVSVDFSKCPPGSYSVAFILCYCRGFRIAVSLVHQWKFILSTCNVICSEIFEIKSQNLRYIHRLPKTFKLRSANCRQPNFFLNSDITTKIHFLLFLTSFDSGLLAITIPLSHKYNKRSSVYWPERELLHTNTQGKCCFAIYSKLHGGECSRWFSHNCQRLIIMRQYITVIWLHQ